MRCQVHLVSGVDTPYTVQLNGQPFTLGPRMARSVRLPEGDVRVEISGTPPAIPAETVSIHTPFLSRPFGTQTVVLNPDRAAVIQRACMYYHPTGSTPRDPELTHAAGEAVYVYSGIDFPFQTPPHQIKMDSRAGAVQRLALSVIQKHDQVQDVVVLAIQSKELGEQTVGRVAQRRLLFQPEQTEFLGIAGAGMPALQFTQFLRPGLQRRPLLINWHRVYQSSMSTAGRSDETQREYEALLAAEPQNNELMYLAARSMRDPDQFNSADGARGRRRSALRVCGQRAGLSLSGQRRFRRCRP